MKPTIGVDNTSSMPLKMNYSIKSRSVIISKMNNFVVFRIKFLTYEFNNFVVVPTRLPKALQRYISVSLTT